MEIVEDQKLKIVIHLSRGSNYIIISIKYKAKAMGLAFRI